MKIGAVQYSTVQHSYSLPRHGASFLFVGTSVEKPLSRGPIKITSATSKRYPFCTVRGVEGDEITAPRQDWTSAKISLASNNAMWTSFSSLPQGKPGREIESWRLICWRWRERLTSSWPRLRIVCRQPIPGCWHWVVRLCCTTTPQTRMWAVLCIGSVLYDLICRGWITRVRLSAAGSRQRRPASLVFFSSPPPLPFSASAPPPSSARSCAATLIIWRTGGTALCK